MAQLRNFQFLRNTTIGIYTNHAAVVTALLSTQDNPLANVSPKDGELVLYRYKITGSDTIHTIVLVAHVAETSGDTSYEIIANYDQISSELQSSIEAINNQINNMDFSNPSTGSDYVKVNVTQVDGAITGVTVDTTTLATKISALETKDGELATAIQTNATNIAANTTAIAALQTKDGELATAIEANANNITANANDIAVNAEAIAANAEAIEANAEAIADLVEKDTELAGLISDNADAIESNAEAIADLVEKDTELAGLISDNADAIADLQNRTNTYTGSNGITINEAARTIAADLVLDYNEDNYTITLKDSNDYLFSSIDAKAFIKDGMVNSASLVTDPEGQDAGTYIALVFNTDVDGQLNHDTIYIPVNDLIDTYTAGNDGIVVDGYEISHKSGVVAENTVKGSVNTTAEGVDYSFNVPTIKVDKYGHVIALTDTAVNITLPSDIYSAVQEIQGSTNDYITTKVTDATENDNTVKKITVTATIGSIDDNSEGLATAQDVREFVSDTAETLRQEMAALPHENTVTTVVAGEGITVTEVEGEGDINYQVALAKIYSTNENNVVNVPTEDTDEQSFADATNSLHVIKDVKVDEEGRVAKIEYMTIVENFDAGTY